MKNHYLILVFLFLLACDHSNQQERPEAKRFNQTALNEMEWPEIPTSIGTEDNPYARIEFDLIRFRDPATGKIPENIREKEIAFARNLPVSSGHMIRDKSGALRNISADFSLAGPVNIGGRSRAVAIDVTNENTLLAGGVSGGLWRSVDQGISWNRVTDVTELPNIRSIVQDIRPGKQNIWYYGTGEILPGSSAGAIGAPYRGNGIYKSTDGGISWNRIPATATGPIDDLTSPFNFVHNLAIDPSNAGQDEIYAAARGGIYRSINGFNSVQLVLGNDNINSNNDGLWTEVAVTSTGIVYATLSNVAGNNSAPTGIFRSTTGESGSWEDITPPSGFGTAYRRTVIGIDPSNENIVYFLGNKGSTNSLHRYDASAPDGQRWTDLSDNIPAFGGTVGDYNAQNSYNMVVAVHPGNSDVVFLGGTNLYRSTNGFSDDTMTDWVGGYSRANTGEQYAKQHADQHALAFFPSNPNRMISGHDGGLSLTNDNLKSTETIDTDEFGETQDVLIEWENLNNGYITSQFYSIAFDEENLGDPGLMGGLQDNSTQLLQEIERDANWFNIGVGDGGFCYYDNESVLLSAQYANIFRIFFENDQPRNATISTPNAGDQGLNLFVNPILVDPVAPNKVFVGARGRVYYTLDVRKNPRDEDWYSFGTPTIDADERVSAMAGSESPAGVLYIGTEGGHLYKTENSTALNQITEITSGSFPANGYISSIAVDPSNADRVVVSFSNYNVNSLFYTTNGGDSWQSVSGNLEAAGSSGGGAPSVRWVTIMPNGGNGNIYLLGTSVGLMSSDELNGNSTVWEREAVNTIGTIPVDMVRVRPIDGYIGVATHGNGIYEARIDVPLSARLQLVDIRCDAGSTVLKTNIQFSGVEDEFDLQYQWFFEDQEIDDLNSPVVTTTTEGRYRVRITNAVNGESALSNEIEVDFSAANAQWCSGNPVTSIDEQIDGLDIFPNPADRYIQVHHSFNGPVNLRIIDGGGRIVAEQTLRQSQSTIDLSDYNPGIYIIMLQSENRIISKKVLKK